MTPRSARLITLQGAKAQSVTFHSPVPTDWTVLFQYPPAQIAAHVVAFDWQAYVAIEGTLQSGSLEFLQYQGPRAALTDNGFFVPLYGIAVRAFSDGDLTIWAQSRNDATDTLLSIVAIPRPLLPHKWTQSLGDGDTGRIPAFATDVMALGNNGSGASFRFTAIDNGPITDCPDIVIPAADVVGPLPIPGEAAFIQNFGGAIIYFTYSIMG